MTPKADDRLPTDPRDRRPAQPADDGGQIGHLRLEMPQPPRIALASPGDEPRRALRYRLFEGDLLVWDAQVIQRTELRNEKSCPPVTSPTSAWTPPLQTIPLTYRVQVTSRVTSSLPERLTLETRFHKARLELPPGLSDQSSLLTSLLESASYVVTLSRTGRTESFLLGKLTGVTMKSVLDRLRTPLGMVQPLLPEPPVGAGASWSQDHRLALLQPGGRVNSHYQVSYGLTRPSGQENESSVHVKISTKVTLDGQVMGETYQGQGLGQGRLELDPERGFLRSASGEMTVCTSVMGRSSRTHTRYSQTFLASESKLTNGKAGLDSHQVRPAPEGSPRTGPKTSPGPSPESR
ncbi:MAG: hypothetical protein RBU30_09700 [Polyangia bacterium]|nr:hypothetical protein [Polyangia bacterium]